MYPRAAGAVTIGEDRLSAGPSSVDIRDDGEKENCSRTDVDAAARRDHPRDGHRLEQYEREGDEVENRTTAVDETVHDGDDRRWIAAKNEALTQRRQRVPSMQVHCHADAEGKRREKSQNEGHDTRHV